MSQYRNDDGFEADGACPLTNEDIDCFFSRPKSFKTEMFCLVGGDALFAVDFEEEGNDSLNSLGASDKSIEHKGSAASGPEVPPKKPSLYAVTFLGETETEFYSEVGLRVLLHQSYIVDAQWGC